MLEVSAIDTALHMSLAPVRDSIEFTEGQVGFLRINEHGLREPHSFTIASGLRSRAKSSS